ncbi:unnamed protein product [Penicillium camemberti]|uniref:Str. FM013 n=1 Tax=Penicillium camemberti (strain FM 013) TaxID=1429867 RepID=A0A0G4PYW2_PENC3|nr:unnamed protein product [Penicillium camemberti]
MTSVFFNRGLEEAGLDPSRVGVDKLRCFLEEILDTHIQRELPKIATNYYNVFQAGIDVSYSSRDASFFEIRDERLSA